MRGHVRKRGSSWTVVYDEGHDEGGRRRQRSKGGFTTRREAEAFLADQLRRLGDGSYAQPSKETVSEYLAAWLPAVEGTLRPLSIQQYQQVIRLRINPSLGRVRLQSLSPAHLNGLYAELEHAGLSTSTRRGTHAVLHRALRDAVRWGKLTRNPADLADPRAGASQRSKPGRLASSVGSLNTSQAIASSRSGDWRRQAECAGGNSPD